MKRCREALRLVDNDVVKMGVEACNELSIKLDHQYHCTLLITPIGAKGVVSTGLMMSSIDDPVYLKGVIESTVEHLKLMKQKEPKND